MLSALRKHWPEYLIEAWGLGSFMTSASLFVILLEHPGSPVPQALPHPLLRRMLMGAAMGLTAIGIIYSPWGKQSGAHLNPSVTLAFFRLGKVRPWDAAFYVLFQFIGGMSGVLLINLIFQSLVSDPHVNYAATLPGQWGAGIAWTAEALISFGLMTLVLFSSNAHRLAPYTVMLAGLLVSLYIAFEAPVSGMSMNPARTFASAFLPRLWETLWIYFTAQPLGMLLAAEVYRRLKWANRVMCAKLHHQNSKRCIFICGYHESC